ncbi:hypothetical protein ACU4GD_44935 [Cupriavidus basilensis]
MVAGTQSSIAGRARAGGRRGQCRVHAWGCARAFRELGAELAITYLSDKGSSAVLRRCRSGGATIPDAARRGGSRAGAGTVRAHQAQHMRRRAPA